MEHDFLDGVYPEEWYNTGLSDSLLCPDSTKQNGEYMCMCLCLCSIGRCKITNIPYTINFHLLNFRKTM